MTPDHLKFAVLVSANAEWRALKPRFPGALIEDSPYGQSGAIAWVAKRNGKALLILRGVSDLVSLEKGEAQGNEALFEENATRIMQTLVNDLPKWMHSLTG